MGAEQSYVIDATKEFMKISLVMQLKVILCMKAVIRSSSALSRPLIQKNLLKLR